jgi:hypothetical protein
LWDGEAPDRIGPVDVGDGLLDVVGELEGEDDGEEPERAT